MPVLSAAPTGHVGGHSGPVPWALTYIDPDGAEWVWSDLAQDVVVTAVSGIGSPPPAATIISMPGGARLAQAYQADSRQIVIGLHVKNNDQNLFNATLDRLHWALWTVRAGEPAPGVLRFSRPDGTSRQIRVLCLSGMDGVDDKNSGLTWAAFPVNFVAEDPFFEDAESEEWSFEAAPVSGGVPAMPPIALAPSTVLGTTSIINGGAVDAYPVWTIHGPGTATMTNTTTGRSFGIDAVLGSGEVITVDTRPLRQSAIDETDANRWPDLVKSSPRDLWALVPGVNNLDLAIASPGVGSKVTISYTRRWLRA